MNDTELDRRMARTPLAIVGMSTLFPGSDTRSGFWNNVVDGVDSITEVPADHWDVSEHYSSDRSAPDKTYASRGGFLDPVAFHPIDFGIPPTQLEVTDVLQLLSLVVARDVLRDAGSDQPWYDRQRTGVVLGVTGANQLTQPLSARLQGPALKAAARSMGLTDADAEELADRYRAAFAPWEENSFPGMLGNVVAGRVANRFDLGGMNMTVDAACASSLGALRAAAAELLDHRADTMITGGCDAENTIFMYLCFSKTPAFSVAGSVRPFDAAADGTLIGEGIGMLALRRLADAERDGNRIYAVVRGIGSASDGRNKSIYAPAASGQHLAIRRAYQDADCEPSSVALVEAHGTGTAVGDATELAALSEVVRDSGAGDAEIAVGSVKSQIGHTKAAAGAAGMIKLALALQHRVLPPTINVDRPAAIFDDGPLHVSSEARPWLPSPGRPVRRAGLSSFGFGGTDFHVVLEEHPASAAIGSDLRRPLVRLWSAPTPSALVDALRTSSTGVESGTTLPEHHPRIAVVAADEDEVRRLRALAADRVSADATSAWEDPRGFSYRPRSVSGEVGMLFAGQGSQYVNPGLTAVLREPVLLDAFDAAARTPGLEGIGRIAFPPPRFDATTRADDEARLRATQHAQPVIGALSVGHTTLLAQLGLAPRAFAGHSFGELTALWAAGAITDADYFPLAAERGAAMAAAADDSDDPGSMAAVLADAATVDRMIADLPSLQVCNRNAPTQHVVGGPSADIDRLITRGTEAGVRIVPLPVAAAFHTPIVAGARDRFAVAVSERRISRPERGKVYANSAGAAYGDDTTANAATLVDQLARPVDFVGVIERMYQDGVRIFVECGPGRVLTRLVSSILDTDDVVVIALDAGDPHAADRSLAEAVARLAVAGVLPTWAFPGQRVDDPAPAGKGPAVLLTGMNHVPEHRVQAYRAALERPYQLEGSGIGTPEPVAPGPQAVTPYEDHHREAQIMSVEPRTTPGYDLAHDQWQAHTTFLAGQHQVSAALLDMLQTPPEAGLDARVVEQVVQQCLAVGEAHVAVNRLVRPEGSADEMRRTVPSLRPAAAAPATGGVLPPAPAVPVPVEPAPPHTSVPAGGASLVVAERPAAAAAVMPVDAAPVDVESLVFGVVADKTGYAAEILELEMGIEADLGIDSIKRVEILGAIGERFPDRAPFSPEEVAELRTLGDLVNALGARPEAGGASLVVAERPAAAAAVMPVDAAPVDVESLVFGVVADKTGYAAEILELEMGIEADLGIDSIKRVEILGAIGERFPDRAPFSPEEVAELRTLGDLVNALRGSAREPSARVASADEGADDEEAAIGIGRAVVDWLPLPAADLPVSRRARRVAVVGTDGPVRSAIERALTGSGHDTVSGQAEDADLVLVVEPGTDPTALLADAVVRVGRTVAAAAEHPELDRRVLLVGVIDATNPFVAAGVAPAGVVGLARTARIEHPEVRSRAVLLSRELAVGDAGRVAAEFDDPADGIDVVRLTETGRAVPRPVPTEVPGTGGRASWDHLTADDVVAITGGARGVTATCVEALAARYPAPTYLLIGRSAPADEPAWAHDSVDEAALRASATTQLRSEGRRPSPRLVATAAREVLAGREIRASLAAVAATGARVEYLVADVTDRESTVRALGPWSDRVRAVIHGAGAIADRLLVDKTAEEASRVLATKLIGLENVLAALPDPSALRHLVLFASAAGLFGNRGQSDYAAANTVLDQWAEAFGAAVPHAQAVALDWGAWDGGMVSDALRAMFAARGYPLVARQEGARLFTEQCEADRAGQHHVLLGPLQPLSEGEPEMRPFAALAPLDDVLRSDLVQEHVVGGRRTLPTSVALNLLVGAASRHLGVAVDEVRDLRVAAGVSEEQVDLEWVIELGSDATGALEARLVSRGDGPGGLSRPRFTAGLRRPGAAPHAVETLDDWLPSVAQVQAWEGPGPLFHGERLSSPTGVYRGEDHVVVTGVRPVIPSPDGTITSFDPVALDAVLQAALVAAHVRDGAVTLPSGADAIRWRAAVAPGGAIAVRLHRFVDGEAGVRMDVLAAALGPDDVWTVFAEIDGLLLTARPDMSTEVAA